MHANFRCRLDQLEHPYRVGDDRRMARGDRDGRGLHAACEHLLQGRRDHQVPGRDQVPRGQSLPRYVRNLRRVERRGAAYSPSVLVVKRPRDDIEMLLSLMALRLADLRAR